MDHRRSLSGRPIPYVAVVTGAAGFVGRLFSKQLAEEGATVILTDLKDCSDLQDEIETAGGKAVSMVCDLSSETDTFRFTSAVLERFAAISVVVNNAAYLPPLKEWGTTSREQMQLAMSINVLAPLQLAQAFYPGMKTNRFGRIISVVSSTTGAPNKGQLMYTTSKAALVGLTRCLARELGSSDNITANAISPGLMQTVDTAAHIPAELFEVTRQRQVIDNVCVPEDLLSSLRFLCDPQSRAISSQIINADGGFNVHT